MGDEVYSNADLPGECGDCCLTCLSVLISCLGTLLS